LILIKTYWKHLLNKKQQCAIYIRKDRSSSRKGWLIRKILKLIVSNLICGVLFFLSVPFPFNLETSAFGLVTDLVPNRSY
jgi:hypothetical protein